MNDGLKIIYIFVWHLFPIWTFILRGFVCDRAAAATHSRKHHLISSPFASLVISGPDHARQEDATRKHRDVVILMAAQGIWRKNVDIKGWRRILGRESMSNELRKRSKWYLVWMLLSIDSNLRDDPWDYPLVFCGCHEDRGDYERQEC